MSTVDYSTLVLKVRSRTERASKLLRAFSVGSRNENGGRDWSPGLATDSLPSWGMRDQGMNGHREEMSPDLLLPE